MLFFSLFLSLVVGECDWCCSLDKFMMPRVSKRLRIGENVIKRVTRSSIRNEKNQTLSSSSGVRGGETSPVQRSLSTLAENKEKSQSEYNFIIEFIIGLICLV